MDDKALQPMIDAARSRLERSIGPTAPDLEARRQRSRRSRRIALAAAVLLVTGVAVISSRPNPGSSVTAGPPPVDTAASLGPGTTRRMAPSPLTGRSTMAAVWTGSEMVIWGGDSSAGPLADGAAYDPRRDSWRRLPNGPLSARNAPAAVWSGREVLLWGGHGAGTGHVDGAAFDPATNAWRTFADAPIRSAGRPLAAWTGTEMIVLAGFNSRDAAAYDPARDSWRLLPDLPGQLQGPAPTLAWTGSRIVTATMGRTVPAGAAALYSLELSADTWVKLPDLGPGLVTLAWTGKHLLGVAGNVAAVLDQGGWEWRGVAEAPSAGLISDGAAVWTGNALLLWAGGDDAFLIDSERRTWVAFPAGGLAKRAQPAGVWADGVFLAWGGFDDDDEGVVVRPPEPTAPSSKPVMIPAPPEPVPDRVPVAAADGTVAGTIDRNGPPAVWNGRVLPVQAVQDERGVTVGYFGCRFLERSEVERDGFAGDESCPPATAAGGTR